MRPFLSWRYLLSYYTINYIPDRLPATDFLKSILFYLNFTQIIVMMLRPCCTLICPNLTSTSPCTCKKNAINVTSITIDCNSKNLNDSQMSRILDSFLSPGISSVYEIGAQFNRLTKVPSQISKFTSLSFVYLDWNQISSIPVIKFLNTTYGSISISLQKNKITSIPLGAFSFPFVSSVFIVLSLNPIRVLPDGAFNFPSAVSVGIDLAESIGQMPSAAVFNFPLVTTLYMDLAGNNITSIPCTKQLNFPRARTASVFLHYNKITTVPSCAFNFPTAQWVTINLGSNLITTISPGVFNFPSSYIQLYLDSNQISVIPPGTFSQGKDKIFIGI